MVCSYVCYDSLNANFSINAIPQVMTYLFLCSIRAFSYRINSRYHIIVKILAVKTLVNKDYRTESNLWEIEVHV